MQQEPITDSPSAQQHSFVEQTAAGACSNGQYAAQHGVHSPRQYVWLGNRPTCTQCGDRGHEAASCSTPFCTTCGKYGHLPGDCTTACRTCGKPHTNKRGCIVCKQCRLFGHLHTMCTETQCGRCFKWGHSTRDCIVEDGGPTTSPGPSSPLQPAAVKASTAMQPPAAGPQHDAPVRSTSRPEQQLQHTAAPYIPRHSPARAAGRPAVGAEEAAVYSSSYEEHQQWLPQPQQHYQQQNLYHQQHYSYQEGYQQPYEYQQPYPHGPPGLSHGPHHPQHWQHSGASESQHQAASSSSYSPGQVPERMQVLSVAQRHLLSYGKLNRTGSNNSSSDGQALSPPPPPPPPPQGLAPAAGDAGQWQAPPPLARQDSSSSTTSMLAALQPEQHVDRQQQQPTEQEQEQQWPQQQEEQQQEVEQQQQQERSSRQYVWPAQIPTCFICGDRGHAADSCTTPSCAVCGRLGHDTGMCERHCSTCGKQHKGRGCKQCKLCGRFGHLSTVCFDSRCDLCGCWGHTKQDCPSVCKCGYHEPHSPAECPGLCTKCLEYGHFTRDCTATQCPICQQWGKGCTDTQCATTGTRTAAAAVPQQQRRPAASTPASSMGRSSSSPQAGRVDVASGSPAAAADRGPSRFASDALRPGSSAEQRSSSSSSTAPPQKQQQAARRPGSSSVSVQLEVLSDAEDVQRRQAFINLLLAQERPELVAYGTQLLDEPGKLTVLVRVPKAVMKAQVLAAADAVQQMEEIYAAHSGSSWRSAEGGPSPAGQQLLPEHADAFEATFPPGFLPTNWRSLTFRAIEDQIPGAKWATLSRYMIEAKEVFRQAKRDAKAKTAAATGQTGPQQPAQQQARQQQGRPQQQQQQDPQAQPEAQQRPGQQQQQVPGYSADRAPARLAESARTASPGSQASSKSQPAAQPRKGTTTSPAVPGSYSSATRQQEMPPAGEQAAVPDAAAFRAEAVQLEAVPPPSVAAERKSQLADILLTHPNGDLRDYGLLLVGDDLRLDVLIRVPWAVLQSCFSAPRAVQLLDELIACHTQQHSPPQQQREAQGPAQQPRPQPPPPPPAAVRQEQQQPQVPPPAQEAAQLPAVPQYVEEDNEEQEEDSEEGSQQQQQQQGATGMAAAQRSGRQQQQGAGSGYEHIKPKDLLPEYAAELEERFKLQPGWRSAASWREVENRYAKSGLGKRMPYRTRRRELQALTAEHLAAAGGPHSAAAAAAVGSSRGASGAQGSSNGTAQLLAEQPEQEPAAAGAVGSSQACAGDYDKQMLPQPNLRAVGSKDDEAREVAFTTRQLFAHLPEYTEQLLGCGDAGAKMSFFSRIDKADLDRVLGQQQVPPGQLLDALYEQHMVAQSSSGGGGQSGVQAGVDQGRAVARLSKGSARGCAQS